METPASSWEDPLVRSLQAYDKGLFAESRVILKQEVLKGDPENLIGLLVIRNLRRVCPKVFEPSEPTEDQIVKTVLRLAESRKGLYEVFMKRLLSSFDSFGIQSSTAKLFYALWMEHVYRDTNESAKWFRAAARDGNDVALCSLATAYLKGSGVDQDMIEACRLYHQAAIKGNIVACYNYAVCLDNGDGCPVDKIEAGKWYKIAADQGDAAAQSNLGSMLREGDLGLPRPDEAMRLFQLAAEQGNEIAQFNLAFSLETLGNNSEAFKWYLTAAKQGYTEAMTAVGICYDSGIGIELDQHEALKWFQQAAENDDVVATYNCGIYAHQKHLIKETIEWMKKAAALGYPRAMMYLGEIHSLGKDLPVDHSEARKWFILAARQPAERDCDLLQIALSGDNLEELQILLCNTGAETAKKELLHDLTYSSKPAQMIIRAIQHTTHTETDTIFLV